MRLSGMLPLMFASRGRPLSKRPAGGRRQLRTDVRSRYTTFADRQLSCGGELFNVCIFFESRLPGRDFKSG